MLSGAPAAACPPLPRRVTDARAEKSPDRGQRPPAGGRLRATPDAIAALAKRPQRVGWRDIAVASPRSALALR